MAIYEITSNQLRKIEETTFSSAGVRERGDLQRLLREQVGIISPDTLVIAEEFCEWEDSKRRIDLLGLGKDANLVVIELKRTEDGGHMELQAVRYAAMVSAMTFDKAVEVHAAHLVRMGSKSDARTSILEFLGWEEPDEDHFAQDVRLVLVSAEFSKELTTAVMWLNERELDIRCIRLKPYSDNGRVLVDVQQVIPLPEAQDYMIRIKEKEGQERKARRVPTDTEKLRLRFWSEMLQQAKLRTDLHADISPSTDTWCAAGAGRSGIFFNYALGRERPRVEFGIGTGDGTENKRVFDQLHQAKPRVEERFGGPLVWDRLDDKLTCRIRFELEPWTLHAEKNWPEVQEKMIEAMIRLEKALRPELDRLE